MRSFAARNMRQKTSPSSLYDHYTYTFFILPEWEIYQFEGLVHPIPGYVRCARTIHVHLLRIILSLLLLSSSSSPSFVCVPFQSHIIPFVSISAAPHLVSISIFLLFSNQSENQIAISNLCLSLCALCVCVYLVHICTHSAANGWVLLGQQ